MSDLETFSIAKELDSFIFGVNYFTAKHKDPFERDLTVADIDSFISDLVKIKLNFQKSEKTKRRQSNANRNSR